MGYRQKGSCCSIQEEKEYLDYIVHGVLKMKIFRFTNHANEINVLLVHFDL